MLPATPGLYYLPRAQIMVYKLGPFPSKRGDCALPVSLPVGLDLQTQDAAEAVDVLGESWSSSDDGQE